MKRILLLLSIILIPIFSYSQEWKNKRCYKKASGKLELEKGNWLKKDRKKNRERWKQSNHFHIQRDSGFNAYRTISQRRDFYKWFDKWRVKKGHEIRWVGVASIVAGQFSKIDSKFIRIFIIRNKNIIKFANEGNKGIFDDVFKYLLQRVYFSDSLIIGDDAIKEDSAYVYREQCEIIVPIYKRHEENKKTIKKIERMAKGKGLYRFGVPKKIKFEGNVKDCMDRFNHGVKKLIPYYKSKEKKLKKKKVP